MPLQFVDDDEEQPDEVKTSASPRERPETSGAEDDKSEEETDEEAEEQLGDERDS